MGFILCLLVLGVVGCGENPKQMFETAQFEELQNNHSHARELYGRIIKADPNSNLAKKAKERLAALQMKEQR
ncbi:MAG: tol-pal system YbgF family protein [Candidatus Binatia bacterium]